MSLSKSCHLESRRSIACGSSGSGRWSASCCQKLDWRQPSSTRTMLPAEQWSHVRKSVAATSTLSWSNILFANLQVRVWSFCVKWAPWTKLPIFSLSHLLAPPSKNIVNHYFSGSPSLFSFPGLQLRGGVKAHIWVMTITFTLPGKFTPGVCKFTILTPATISLLSRVRGNRHSGSKSPGRRIFQYPPGYFILGYYF